MPSADLDVEDNEGSTALDSAVSACHQKAITFLLLHGAQIKARYVAFCSSPLQVFIQAGGGGHGRRPRGGGGWDAVEGDICLLLVQVLAAFALVPH